mmetsp:Transcript_27091/g.92504  ORF Transcript_27091/g.92504 Transcript_27091/m.92504 type:complete len:214 (+) Transcript_27091:1936-2577(+)
MSRRRYRNSFPVIILRPRYRNRPEITTLGTPLSTGSSSTDAPIMACTVKPVTRVSRTEVMISRGPVPSPRLGSMFAWARMWLRLWTVAATIHGRPSTEQTPTREPSTTRSQWYAEPFFRPFALEFTTRDEMFWSRKKSMVRSTAGTAAAAGTHVGTSQKGMSQSRPRENTSGTLSLSSPAFRTVGHSCAMSVTEPMAIVGPKSEMNSRIVRRR